MSQRGGDPPFGSRRTFRIEVSRSVLAQPVRSAQLLYLTHLVRSQSNRLDLGEYRQVGIPPGSRAGQFHPSPGLPSQRCCPVLRGVRRTLRRPPPRRKSAGSRACHARLPGQTETNGSDRRPGRRPAGAHHPGETVGIDRATPPDGAGPGSRARTHRPPTPARRPGRVRISRPRTRPSCGERPNPRHGFGRSRHVRSRCTTPRHHTSLHLIASRPTPSSVSTADRRDRRRPSALSHGPARSTAASGVGAATPRPLRRGG